MDNLTTVGNSMMTTDRASISEFINRHRNRTNLHRLIKVFADALAQKYLLKHADVSFTRDEISREVQRQIVESYAPLIIR